MVVAPGARLTTTRRVEWRTIWCMSRGRVGATGGIVRRKQLKPAREQTDEQLLASAARAAEKAAKRAERERRVEQVEGELRRPSTTQRGR